MTSMSRELQVMLQAALREAAVRRHSYVTVEHVLYAMLHDTRGAEILRHSGAELTNLKAALQRYFDEDLEQVPGDAPFDTLQTLAFHRMLENGVMLPPSPFEAWFLSYAHDTDALDQVLDAARTSLTG